jgi:diguanylate cyclase (GGDEF)-like protein
LFQRQKVALSFNTLNEEQKLKCYIQINNDIADRSIPGIFYYLIVWFCIVYLLHDSPQEPHLISWLTILSLTIVITSIIRGALIYVSKKLLDNILVSRRLLEAGMVISSLSWGVMASLAFLDTPLSSQQEIIFLSTVGLCGGGALSFCASRMFTTLFLVCMLLPILVVQLFLAPEIHLQTVMIAVVYFMGLISATRHPYREYMSSLISHLKLEEISNTDALTNVRNRRFFDLQLDEEIKRAQRNQVSLSLLLIDVDHFKQVNDQHGHPAGDKCLTVIGERLMQSLHRVSDTVARFGGEEFAIILPNVSSEKCKDLAEEIRLDIAAHAVNYDSKNIQLSVSIGCYSVNNVLIDTNVKQLVSKADEALYKAKRLGRNRVEIIHD